MRLLSFGKLRRNTDDQVVHETGINPLSAIYVFYAAGAARGCASPQPQSKPFSLSEEGLETHGRKTWFDRLFDADPGGASFVIAADYQERPPRKIAVPPFANQGKGSYVIDTVPVKTFEREELDRRSWTHTNRVRRALAGDLATREFVIVSC